MAYKINGSITLKISRSELDLLINSLKIIIPIVKEKYKNHGSYKDILDDLYKIEKQWSEEEEYFKSKKSGGKW